MRLDVFLAEHGFAASRTEARRLIEEGAVLVDGIPVTKPAFTVDGREENILLNRAAKSYVSRGGLKLDGALCAFDLVTEGRLCLDVGASSGGFTDCLLRHGAARVIAADVGSGQLAPVLRADPRVSVLEHFNARYMEPEDFPYVPDLAVMDVSFISATLLLEPLYRVLADRADFICLVKPQFEVGRGAVGKGGIVRDESARRAALNHVCTRAQATGFTVMGAIPSPIRGGDGNIEYLVHFRKGDVG